MDDPDYLIVNPLHIELSSKNSNKTRNNERKLTEIEKRFYDKMEKLKNISLESKQLKYIIHHHHGLILVDI